MRLPKHNPFRRQIKEENSNTEISLDFMDKIGTISKQSIVFFSGTIFSSVIGYFFTVFIARRLGSQVLGYFALGMSIVTLSVVISTLGLPMTSARFIALYVGLGENNKITAFLRYVSVIIICTSILLGVAVYLGRYWIAEGIFHKPQLTNFIPLFALMVPVTAASQLLFQTLTGFQKVDNRTLIDSFLRVLLKIIISLGLISLGMGLGGWIVGEISSGIISIIFAAWLVFKLTPKSKFSWDASFSDLDMAFIPFAATMLGVGIITFVWQQISHVISGIFLTAGQVGIFTSAVAIGSFIPVILLSVNAIFGPIISELHSTGNNKILGLLFQTLTKWVLGLTWPLTIVIIVFAPMIMRIYGAEFEQGWLVLVIIAFGQFLNTCTGSVGLILVMSGNQSLEFLAGLCAAIISLILSIVLIPLWGIIGAGLATAIGTTIANLLSLLFVNKVTRLTPYNRYSGRLFPPLVASGFFVFIFRKLSITSSWPDLGVLFMALLISFTTFLIIMFMMGLDEYDHLIFNAAKLKMIRFMDSGSNE